MEAFLNFFEQMPNHYKLFWIFICLSANWFIEAGSPLVHLNYKKWRHAGVNFVFLGTTITINVLFGLATLGIFTWTATNNIGLLQWVNFPIWVELLLALMLLDLIAQYFVHYLLHKIPFMWRFHMVHHSDTHVDATTGTRHHPIDYMFREAFALIAIIVTGMPLAFYLFYRIVTVFFTYFTHANIALPKGIDKALTYVVVSPNMHKFHHHFKNPWTDMNYGNIFSFWDRIFGTMVYEDTSKIKYGLDVLEENGNRDEDVLYQFVLPFDKKVKSAKEYYANKVIE